jgi:hypothetical protein
MLGKIIILLSYYEYYNKYASENYYAKRGKNNTMGNYYIRI